MSDAAGGSRAAARTAATTAGPGAGPAAATPPAATAPPAGTPVPDAPVVVPGLLDALRADLEAAGLTVDALAEAVGPVANAALGRDEPWPALRATRAAAEAGDPVAVLGRLLVLGAPVSRRALDRALPRAGSDGAARLGLVAVAGAGPDDAVRPLLDLRPHTVVDALGEATWWVVSDLGESATGGPLRTDHVLGIGGASTMLAGATVRDRRGRALDLGTGSGVQALHATRHCDRVVATDVSARALAFAAFTLALNGVPGAAGPGPGPGSVELRRGSLLEPVAGEAFDLVVSNPPFVSTPRRADTPVYTYRDGGRTGDDLVRELVAGLPAHLAPGGVAQLLANWEVPRGQVWTERVGGWLAGLEVDAWVVQRDLLDPAHYAETWLRDGGLTPERDLAAWRARYDAWLDDLEARGVEAIGMGLVTLRRPGGDRAGAGTGTGAWSATGDAPGAAGAGLLRRLEEVTGPLHGPLGPVVSAGLAAHDWLAARDDAALLAARLTVAGDVTEERHLLPGAADPTVLLLRQGGGLGRTVRAGTALAGLVGACDGELAVGAIVDAIAALLDAPAGDLRAELLPAVRGLVADGLLLPA